MLILHEYRLQRTLENYDFCSHLKSIDHFRQNIVYFIIYILMKYDIVYNSLQTFLLFFLPWL